MSNINHSAANQALLGMSPPLVLDFDLSKPDLGAPIALEAEAPAQKWLPGDELHREAYELVRAGGVVWRDACRRVGVDYSTAQHRYRLRGLPSPIRTFPSPAFGTREETAAVVYSLVLHGQPVSTAAPRNGISRQYFWSWCKRSRLPNPTAALRAAAPGIKAITRFKA
jgi:hypothetical protein